MEPIQFVDKALLPIFVSILYLIIYRRKRVIYSTLKDKKFVRAIRHFLGVPPRLLLSNFRLKIESWKSDIIAPVSLVLIIDILIMIIFLGPMLPYNYSLWFLIIVSGFFSSIFEEILFRGFLLGAFLTTYLIFHFEKANRKRLNRSSMLIWASLAIVAQALIFTLLHENPTTLSWNIRMLYGILYGLLYLKSRNLLSPIIAHITHNNLITAIGITLGATIFN